MRNRILSFTSLVTLLTLATTGVFAGDPSPYADAAFKKAQSEGKTVLVDFAAPWCSTCEKQGPVIDSLLKEGKYKGIVAFKADFDTEKELKKQLRVHAQSTLVVFKGKKEAGRAIGLTDRASIEELLAKGL